MKYHYDLRPLFLEDRRPEGAAPFYDIAPGSFVLDAANVREISTSRTRVLPLHWMHEPEFQGGLASLLIGVALSNGPDREPSVPDEATPAEILAALDSPRILLSPKTLGVYKPWHEDVQAVAWRRILDRDVYLHAAVADGGILALRAREDVGLISRSLTLPYPVGAFARPGGARLFRLAGMPPES